MTAPRKILVVNLTRFGDLLQTGPTILGLKQQWPESELTVVVERNFADVCEGLPGIDRIWPIDLDSLGRLLLAPSVDGLRAAYAWVAEEVTRWRAERFDLALNYSSSRMSAALMRLIGAPDTRGWNSTADGHRVISSPWARLFSSACLNRRQAPFNLVDYYKRTAGVIRGPQSLRFDVPVAAATRAEELLREGGWDGQRPLIAFQLGASRAIRRWPASNFVTVGRTLIEREGADIVLCGGKGERAFAEEIAAGLNVHTIDVCGRTTVAELGGVLSRCGVLLTGDTGPMHMAVAVGTPVVSLFFGPALPADTAPYAPEQLCLHASVGCAPCDHNITCLDPFCRDVFGPPAVAEAVAARRVGDWRRIEKVALGVSGFDWYRTTVDASGFADLELLNQRPPRRHEVLRKAVRAVFLEALAGAPAEPTAVELPDDAAMLREVAQLADLGVTLTKELEAALAKDADVDGLERIVGQVEGVDREILRRGAAHDATAVIVQMFRFEKQNLEDGTPDELTRATRVFHEDLAVRAQRLADILDRRPHDGRIRSKEECHASIG